MGFIFDDFIILLIILFIGLLIWFLVPREVDNKCDIINKYKEYINFVDSEMKVKKLSKDSAEITLNGNTNLIENIQFIRDVDLMEKEK